jgi:hypothetical protein
MLSWRLLLGLQMAVYSMVEFMGTHTIWDSQSSDYEGFCLLRCYAMYFTESQPTFRRVASSFMVQGFLFGAFFDLEYWGYMFLRNVRWLSTDYTALYSTVNSFSLGHTFSIYVLVYPYNPKPEQGPKDTTRLLCVVISCTFCREQIPNWESDSCSEGKKFRACNVTQNSLPFSH